MKDLVTKTEIEKLVKEEYENASDANKTKAHAKTKVEAYLRKMKQKSDKIEAAVKAAKSTVEENCLTYSDEYEDAVVDTKDVTRKTLVTAAFKQVSNEKDEENTQDKVTAAAKQYVINIYNKKIQTAVKAAQKEALNENVEMKDEEYRKAAKAQAKYKDPEKTDQHNQEQRKQAKLDEAAIKVVKKQVATKNQQVDEKVEKAVQAVKEYAAKQDVNLKEDSYLDNAKEAAKNQAKENNSNQNKQEEVTKAAMKVVEAKVQEYKKAIETMVYEAVKAAKIYAIDEDKALKEAEYTQEATRVAKKEVSNYLGTEANAKKDAQFKVTEAAEKVVENQEEDNQTSTTVDAK